MHSFSCLSYGVTCACMCVCGRMCVPRFATWKVGNARQKFLVAARQQRGGWIDGLLRHAGSGVCRQQIQAHVLF